MMKFTPFGGKKEKIAAACKAIFDEGAIVFYCGHNPSRIRMLPPLPVLKAKDWPRIFAVIEHGWPRSPPPDPTRAPPMSTPTPAAADPAPDRKAGPPDPEFGELLTEHAQGATPDLLDPRPGAQRPDPGRGRRRLRGPAPPLLPVPAHRLPAPGGAAQARLRRPRTGSRWWATGCSSPRSCSAG